MNNYEYTPQELKIIIGIANKHKIPISLGDNSITIHSKQDLKPLMIFSTNGFDLLVEPGSDNLDYYQKIFMRGKVTLKSWNGQKTLKVLEYDANWLLAKYTLRGN